MNETTKLTDPYKKIPSGWWWSEQHWGCILGSSCNDWRKSNVSVFSWNGTQFSVCSC